MSLLYDGIDQSLSLNADRAYDKNEMNCYQEVIGHTLCLLPRMKNLISKLSPRMQESTFKKEIPSDLLDIVLPDLPGDVKIDNLCNLLTFIEQRKGERFMYIGCQTQRIYKGMDGTRNNRNV